MIAAVGVICLFAGLWLALPPLAALPGPGMNLPESGLTSLPGVAGPVWQ